MPELHPFVSGKWQANIPQPLPGPQQWFDNGNSFCYAPRSEMQSIFLGSFPTYQVVNLVRHNGNKEFFYGSVDNEFWPLLQMLTGLTIATEHDLFQMLNKTNFGITDILKRIDRNGNGSADSSLSPMLFNDIIDLKSNFQNLTSIYTTSGGKGSVSNKSSVSAAKWLRDSLFTLGYTVSGFSKTRYQKQISVFRNGQLVWKFSLIHLWSPSRNANKPIKGIINRSTWFHTLLITLPQPFCNFSLTMRARLIQWAFLLNQNGFPINAQLSTLLTTQRITLANYLS